MPLLAASEKGIGQAESAIVMLLEMWCRYPPYHFSQSCLERHTLEGDSPVERRMGEGSSNRVGLPGLEV